MIFTLDEINVIWLNRIAESGKSYACNDGFIYNGLSDGTLSRSLVGNKDDYNKKILDKSSYNDLTTTNLMKEVRNKIRFLEDKVVAQNKALEEKIKSNEEISKTNDAILFLKTQTIIAKTLK